jgi:hypothetical protein
VPLVGRVRLVVLAPLVLVHPSNQVPVTALVQHLLQVVEIQVVSAVAVAVLGAVMVVLVQRYQPMVLVRVLVVAVVLVLLPVLKSEPPVAMELQLLVLFNFI